MWYIHTMEYYPILTRKEILTYAATWINHEDIILSEIWPSQKTNMLIPLIRCYGLNVCVSTKFLCWNLIPTVIAFGGGASEKWLGHEGGALMNRTSALIKETPMGAYQIYKLLHSKGNHKKTTYGTGENICKRCDWQGLNFQNIQTAHTTQNKAKKKKNHKMGRTPKKTFLHRRHTDGQ